jgi:hypothetical protein
MAAEFRASARVGMVELNAAQKSPHTLETTTVSPTGTLLTNSDTGRYRGSFAMGISARRLGKSRVKQVVHLEEPDGSGCSDEVSPSSFCSVAGSSTSFSGALPLRMRAYVFLRYSSEASLSAR